MNMTNYMPVPFDAEETQGAEWGIHEAGLFIRAWQPRNDQAPRKLVLQVWRGDHADGEPVREEEIPMYHPNIFGIDIEDMAALEKVTDDVISEESS